MKVVDLRNDRLYEQVEFSSKVEAKNYYNKLVRFILAILEKGYQIITHEDNHIVIKYNTNIYEVMILD